MKLDDSNPVESNDQVDSPPAYPPPTPAHSARSIADGEAIEESARDGQVSDVEVTRPVADSPADVEPAEETALFERSELDGLNKRWSDVQASFVDEPRTAVQQADALVSDVIAQIGESFGNQRTRLEKQWDRGDEVSTEDLRQTFQRYRSFFSRLLDL